MKAIVLAVGALAACVQDELVACDDGRLCPAGSVCTATSCADRNAVDACDGLAEGGACAAPGIGDGVCATGVCTLRGCGNSTIDDASSETCDDGNTVSGDGCTSTCDIEGCGNGKPDASETCDDSNITAHDGCSATCQRELPQWTTTEPSLDDERSGAAVAFIPARGHIVRFGGFDVYEGIRSGTHELVGNEWMRVTTAHSPSARANAASAYDPVRQRWVLFGGTNFTDYVGETWELDGTDWTKIAVPGPTPSSCAMTYAAASARIVMYCGDPVSETWMYDGNAWTQLVGAQPPARYWTSLAYDPTAGGRVVLFGGRQTSDGTDIADVWVLAGSSWSQLTTNAGPVARHGHSIVFDPGRNGIVLNGGGEDTWLLQGSTWTPIGGTQARFASDLALVIDPVRNKLVRYGGYKSEFVFDEIYELDATGWTRTNATGPLDRTAAFITTDTKRDRIIMFGGDSWSAGDNAETWSYDATGWNQIVTANAPQPTSYQGMTYDPVRDLIVLLADGKTWECDGADWTQVTTAVNAPVYTRGPLIYDKLHGRIVTVKGATYTYDGVDWATLPSVPGSGTVYEYAAAYDSDRDRVMLFNTDDLYELDGDTWVMVAPGPIPIQTRYRSTMGYDPIRHRLVLTGGATSDTGKQNDTWEWDGTAWTQIVTTGTYSPRETPAFAWLPSAGGFVLFGGNDTAFTMHDTWLYRWDALPQ